MLNKEIKAEIWKKLGNDDDVRAMLANHDVQGLLAKTKEAGFALTEADVTEFMVGSAEISDEELSAVSGGCSIVNDGCGSGSCHG